jgi:DNA-binding GntR family transcriptional regulator
MMAQHQSSGAKIVELGSDGPESAREKAYRTAFDAISGMRIGEDGFIREDELVEMAGVSRTPVREALQRLQAEGMVRLVPRKGAYVSAITPYEIQDLLECRSLFESFAADAVIRENPKQTIERLQALLDEQYRGYREGAPQAHMIDLDRQWHSALVAASRNKMIYEMHQSLKNREVRLMITVLSGAGPDRWGQAIEEHEKILKTLRDGDAEAARAAISFHCHQTGRAAMGDRMSITG